MRRWSWIPLLMLIFEAGAQENEAPQATVEPPAESVSQQAVPEVPAVPPPAAHAMPGDPSSAAQEPAPMDEGDSDEEALPEAPKVVPKKRVSKGVYGNREVEGTRALDRGQVKSDAVIRSFYKLNGETLEVDPD